MSNIFIILFVASLAGAVVGVIRPSTVRFQSRIRALLVFGGATLFFLILVGLTSSSRPATQAPDQVVTTTTTQQSDTPDGQIKQIVMSVPSNGKYQGSGTIGKVDVYHVPDQNNPTKFVGWGVDVDLHIEGSRTLMNEEIAEVYYALYSNRKDITSAAISVYEPVSDKYGNQKNMEVYHTFLKADEASKVNWSLGHDDLVYTVLPKVWTVNLDMSASNPALLQ